MQTLPIAYYPTLSDADIDKLLADEKPDTVEFMITPKRDVGSVQMDKLAEEMHDVSLARIPQTRAGVRDVDHLTDCQVERIEITSANRTTWVTDSDLLKSLDLHPEATREGGAEVGDVVWLDKTGPSAYQAARSTRRSRRFDTAF